MARDEPWSWAEQNARGHTWTHIYVSSGQGWAASLLIDEEHRVSCLHTENSDQMSLSKSSSSSIPNCCQYTSSGLSGS